MKKRSTPTMTPEQRQEKMSAIMTTLEQGIASVFASDGYAAYLAAMSRFHGYSFGNTVLIMHTMPDATRVAGFNAWRAMGRAVKKGEKGIPIMVPLKGKAEENDNGDSVYVVRGFGVGYVFDVSQTDGDALPEHPANTAILTNDHAATETIISALIAFATEQGAHFTEISDGPRGYWMPRTREIAVRADLAGIGRAKTLTHEVAHMLAEHGGGEAREDAENVAESAAYVVMQHFGIDTSEYSFGYVAGWAKDMQLVKRNLAQVQRIAHQMIDAINGKDSV